MKKILSFIAIVLIFSFEACITEDPLSKYKDDDSRIYISNFDKKINFKDYKTFSISDTVLVLSNERLRISTKISDKIFINYFRENLIAAKFNSINKANKPDLGIQISRVANTKIGLDAFYIQDFNRLWGYPQFDNKNSHGYPGIYTNYEISEPIWNIEVVDLKNALKNDKLNIIWNAQIHGKSVLEEDNFGFLIDKIFEISPFLFENK